MPTIKGRKFKDKNNHLLIRPQEAQNQILPLCQAVLDRLIQQLFQCHRHCETRHEMGNGDRGHILQRIFGGTFPEDWGILKYLFIRNPKLCKRGYYMEKGHAPGANARYTEINRLWIRSQSATYFSQMFSDKEYQSRECLPLYLQAWL